MTTINFIKTPTPKMHNELKTWYVISIIALVTVVVAIISAQTYQLRSLRAAQATQATLMKRKKEWDTIIEKQERLMRDQKQLQEYLKLIQAINTQQQHTTAYFDAIKKTVREASGSLMSLALNNNKNISITIQCSSQNGACALSHSLAQAPTIQTIKMTSLQPNTSQGKEAYLVTMKGIVK